MVYSLTHSLQLSALQIISLGFSFLSGIMLHVLGYFPKRTRQYFWSHYSSRTLSLFTIKWHLLPLDLNQGGTVWVHALVNRIQQKETRLSLGHERQYSFLLALSRDTPSYNVDTMS